MRRHGRDGAPPHLNRGAKDARPIRCQEGGKAMRRPRILGGLSLALLMGLSVGPRRAGAQGPTVDMSSPSSALGGSGSTLGTPPGSNTSPLGDAPGSGGAQPGTGTNPLQAVIG